MIPPEPYLRWIDDQHERMCRLVTDWANINSGSHNLSGLGRMLAELKREFTCLGGEMTEVTLPRYMSIDADGHKMETSLGGAISIRKRADAPVRVFLGIHMDTVYGTDHPFQKVERVDANTLRGPGVADAKGGLCVMLIALEALERSGFANDIGWEVFINSDEELGSPGAAGFFAEAAKRNHAGLVYEPARADGTLIGARKGSGNFTAIIRGKSAHAGRDFTLGRNAMHAAGALVVALDGLNGGGDGATVNVGRIDGGGPVNIVPDLAIVRFNVRVPTRDDQRKMESELHRVIEEIGRREGITAELIGGFTSPPKPMDDATLQLFRKVAKCGHELGLSLNWQPSGGVTDGNKLAAAGLPVVDSLGPRGGSLHSTDEFLLLDSLAERAKLSALLLMKLSEEG